MQNLKTTQMADKIHALT